MIRSLGFATLALSVTSPAWAESLESRVARLEAQNAELQAAQPAGAPKRLGEALSVSGLRNAISGLIEVEAGYFSPESGEEESDVVLATFELGIAAQINDWVEATAALLYEQDETDLEVDVAFITLANPDVSPLFLTAGQLYVPFGAYETHLVSDPLTLEIGESRETAVQAGFVTGGLSGSAYVFNGDNKIDGKNQIGSWGATLGYGVEADDRAWSLGVGYISDLGDSDALHEVVNANRVAALDAASAAGLDTTDFSSDPTERTAGWTVHAGASVGAFSLIGEYLAATDDFAAESLAFAEAGAAPAAWNLELGFSFPVMGRESVAAISHQETREALGLELPEQRWLLGWSVEIFERTAVSFEWARDEDYDTADGGSGESADTFTAQLAVEF